MKKISLLCSLLALVIATQAQNGITLCHTPATEKFALFASSKDFNMEHPNPRIYVHRTTEGGKMITFDCPDGKQASGYLIMTAEKTNNWVLVFQEWWGLNDNVKRQSEDLFKDLGNVNVLALDMYDGKLATTREDAGKYMQEFKAERGTAIVQGALAYAGKDAKIGTLGWCFGGGLSLQAALTAGKQTVACVMFYGFPEEDVNRLKTLNSDVLNIWPTQDKWINKEVMDRFDKNMKEAGKQLTIKAYDANHGFANPSNPIGTFNEEAYRDSWKNTLEYFRKRF